ncbi:hypothetical protein D3C79_854900 [compost metagenome]
MPGHRQRATVEQLGLQDAALFALDQQGRGSGTPADPAKTPRGIDTGVRFHVHLGPRHRVDGIAVTQNQHFGQLRIADQRVNRVADGQAQAAIGDPWQQSGPGWMLGGQPGQQPGSDIGSIGQ